MKSISPIGLIGLGLVGQAVLKRLHARCFTVVGYDINSEAMEKAEALGATTVCSPAEVAKTCSLILLSLPDALAVRQVLWGKKGLATDCTRNTILLDMTTTSPEQTIQHAKKLREKEIYFYDAPLVGSSEEIANGKGVALLGTKKGTVPRAEKVIRSFCHKIYFLGEVGNAHTAKLIVNLVLGANRLVLAEALGLANRCGMALEEILDLLRHTAAYSRVMDTKGKRMCLRQYDPPAARLAQHAKDVRLILQLAKAHGARSEIARLHAKLLEEALDLGLGDQDNAAIVELFLNRAG